MPMNNITCNLKRTAGYILGFVLFYKLFMLKEHQQKYQIKSWLDSLKF